MVEGYPFGEAGGVKHEEHMGRNENNKVPVRVYKAGGSAGGIFSSLRMAGEEVWQSRYIIWRLFARDFIGQFRQKVLGIFWVFISPLLGIASFVFMNLTGILNPGKVEIPYPVFVFFGMTLWGIMIGTLTTVSGGLLAQTDLVMRTNIPKIALAVTGLAHVIYGILINLIVLLIITTSFRVIPSWGALLYPFMILPLVILGIGIGLILAVIGAVARDITGMVTTAMGLAMYVTPVLYTAEFENPLIQAIVNYNPLTYLVDVTRKVFFLGNFQGLTAYLMASGCCLVILLLGIHSFYLIKDKVAERL